MIYSSTKGPSYLPYIPDLRGPENVNYEQRIELAKKLLAENVPVRKILPKVNFTPNKLSELKKEMSGQTTGSKFTQAYRLLEEYEITKYNDRALLKIALSLA